MVIVIGADVHKATHTFVAVDPVGRKLGERTVKATTSGHESALRWARAEFGSELRWGVVHLHELDPEFEVPVKALRTRAQRDRVAAWLTTRVGLIAELAADVLADIVAVSVKIDELLKRITVLVEESYPHLLAIPGCGPLAAAKIVGETANVDRFRSEACFAMNAGVAPLPVWSGSAHGRVRMSRSGNRQLNAALHRIAVTQIRLDGPGRTYYRKRLEHGDSTVEALRCLKRRLARIVFNALEADQATTRHAASLPLAA